MEAFVLGFYITLGIIAALGTVGAGILALALIASALASMLKWLLPGGKSANNNNRFNRWN